MASTIRIFTDNLTIYKASWDAQKAAGVFDSKLYPSFAGAAPVACVDGVAEVIAGDANNTFRCSNVRESSG